MTDAAERVRRELDEFACDLICTGKGAVSDETVRDAFRLGIFELTPKAGSTADTPEGRAWLRTVNLLLGRVP